MMSVGLWGLYIVAVLIGNVYLQLQKKMPDCFPKWLYQCILPPSMYESCHFSTSWPIVGKSDFQFFAIVVYRVVIMVVIFISVITNEVKHLFLCWPFVFLFLKCLDMSFVHFSVGLQTDYSVFSYWFVGVIYFGHEPFDIYMYSKCFLQFCVLFPFSSTVDCWTTWGLGGATLPPMQSKIYV